MNIIIKKSFLYFSLFLGLQTIFAQNENPVISAIQKEVDRNEEQLKMENMPTPFFISYWVLDRIDHNMSASLGSISSYYESHIRRGFPTLLVGNYQRNNLKLPGRSPYQSTTSLIDNSTGIPITIWRDMDGVYKDAVEKYQTKLAVLQQ
jgi:hypothetical protein